MAGRLSLVATPIGHLDDITLRALDVLRSCDRILAEDTRRTRILCTHHGIQTPLRAFHAHSGDHEVEALAAELRDGAHFALVSDAGTPLVSDPGARLCEAAVRDGVRVEPIPGASAVLAALTASGLGGRAFRFVGFLPRSGRARREGLGRIVAAEEVTVLFESPRRVGATLAELADLAPERRAVVARELTKLHEELARGTLAELAAAYAGDAPRGEITLVVDGAPPLEGPLDREAASSRAAELLADGLRAKDAARRLATEHGIPVREAYALVVSATVDE